MRATVNCLVCHQKSFSANMDVTRFLHDSNDMYVISLWIEYHLNNHIVIRRDLFTYNFYSSVYEEIYSIYDNIIIYFKTIEWLYTAWYKWLWNKVFKLTSLFSNINWRDVQRKNVVNNVDMSSLRAPWQNGPYKNNTQNDTKTRTTPCSNRHLDKTIVLCLSDVFPFIYNFLNKFSKKCWVTVLVRLCIYSENTYIIWIRMSKGNNVRNSIV